MIISPEAGFTQKIGFKRNTENSKLRKNEREQSERENDKKDKTTPKLPTPPIEKRREELIA